jgi:putative ABC transport system permease protein
MLKNYFVTAIRNLLKYKGYALINMIGLAIGIASSILIFLYVQDEWSYDRFNEKFDRIYRVYLKGKIQGNEMAIAVTNAPIGPTMVAEFPEVEQYTRLFTFTGNPLVRYEDKAFVESKFYFADSTFFDVFTCPVISSASEKMLNKPKTVVITEEMAKKYFGNGEAIGKVLEIGDDRQTFEVVGVVKGFPKNAHFTFNILASMSTTDFARNTIWLSNNNSTYIVLKKGTPYKTVEDKIPDMMAKYLGPQLQQFVGVTLEEFRQGGNTYGYFLQPLKDIHLRSDLQYEIEPGGSITTVYIFSIIALFIIIIASINFMNLSTARASTRAQEVGVRKVVGSDKSKLVFQFLAESLIITFISLVIAVLLVELCMPSFNHLTGKDLVFSLGKNSILVPVLLGLLLFIGLLSGSYPAFFLASFQPVKVLKGQMKTGMKGGWLRSILVVLQFSITIALLVSTIVVFLQLRFINRKDLGFDKKDVVLVERAYAIKDKKEAFRQELLKNPKIVSVSYSNFVPGSILGNTAYVPEGASARETNALNIFFADPEFQGTYALSMEEGRWFNEKTPTDSHAVVINEATVKALGFDHPLSSRLIQLGGDSIPFPIIGVVKDFHYQSLHQEIKPLVIHFDPGYLNWISIKIRPEDRNETMKFIEKTWREFAPEQPVFQEFLDDYLATAYKANESTGLIFSIFSILAIFIATLGLLGLASFSAEQRTKEVGVRKVHGASVFKVMVIFTKEVLWLMFFATLIAWPLSYFFMKDWLQDFAFRIKLSPLIFLLSTLIALFIALVTVSTRAYRAAIVNPAQSLRYE